MPYLTILDCNIRALDCVSYMTDIWRIKYTTYTGYIWKTNLGIIVSADGWGPTSAWPSAGSVMTSKLGMVPWVSLNINVFQYIIYPSSDILPYRQWTDWTGPDWTGPDLTRPDHIHGPYWTGLGLDVFIILVPAVGPEYSRRTGSILCLQLPKLIKSAIHQHPGYGISELGRLYHGTGLAG